jgi:hypothetical protein
MGYTSCKLIILMQQIRWHTVTAFEFFCITNHLKMATNRGRNM